MTEIGEARVSEYDPEDWLIALGIALCAVGILGLCTWRILEAAS